MLKLMWAYLKSKKRQLTLTLFSVVMAFLLFGILMAIRQGFSGKPPESQSATLRMTTLNKISPYAPLPVAYYDRIASVPGVKAVTYLSAFAGFFQRKSNFVLMFAVPATKILNVYPDLTVSPQELNAWIADRSGVLATPALLKQYDWHVGDHVPIGSSILKKDGSTTWDVTIDGLIRTRAGAQFSSQKLFMHYQYLDQARDSNEGTVDLFVELAASSSQTSQISHAIDQLFVNASPQTQTNSSNAMLQEAYAAAGNVGVMIVGMALTVFFSMILITGAVMLHSTQQRFSEFAILRALGFSKWAITGIILGESILVCLVGGGIGLTLAYLLIMPLQSALAQNLVGITLTPSAIIAAIISMIGLGLLSGALPAIQTWRLSICEALRSN